jgi:RNA polymerase sigma-70 factor (ECF subfamily)
VPATDQQPTVATDDALLERIVLRDEDAVAVLYDRHSRLLYGVILRILRDRAEAEDILQEVFWSVWSKAASYNRALGVPAAWLVRLARNRAIDRIRASAVRARAAEAAGDPTPTDSPEQFAVASEQRADILRALRSLPEEQQMLIEQAYYAGLTQSELAARFDLPLGTVKTRIRSGIIALREQLATHE